MNLLTLSSLLLLIGVAANESARGGSVGDPCPCNSGLKCICATTSASPGVRLQPALLSVLSSFVSCLVTPVTAQDDDLLCTCQSDELQDVTDPPTAKASPPATAPTAEAPTAAPPNVPTPTTSAGGVACAGPFPDYPECSARLDWLLENWETSEYSDNYRRAGIDGTRCSIQHYLASVENYCPEVDGKDNAPIATAPPVATTPPGATTPNDGQHVTLGVNIFGSGGFDNDEALRRALRTLMTNGILHFRVNNVGGWHENVLQAIDDLAGELGVGDRTSVAIPSQFFASPATCEWFPVWMDFSLSSFESKLGALKNVQRKIVQIDTCTSCCRWDSSLGRCAETAQYYCTNPTEQGMGQSDTFGADFSKADLFRNFYLDQSENGFGKSQLDPAHEMFPIDWEFVLAWQNEQQSPEAMVSGLVVNHITAMREAGRKVYIEGTLYPYWTSNEQNYAPFPTTQVQGFVNYARETSKIDGFVLAETGWPQRCDTPSDYHRPANLENMCKYLSSVLSEVDDTGAELSYLWKLGPSSDGSCGSSSWGLFNQDGSFVCEGRVQGWKSS